MIVSIAFHGDVPDPALHIVAIAVLQKDIKVVIIPLLSASIREPV